MEKAYESVKKLVEDFRAHERDYLSPNYQESHVRQDFIDKFFTALGWDVTHTRQKNPHEYEVQIENRVQIGSTQQRADYAFFLGPNFRDPKFYVEAKKPARQLHNPDFFYQTMRYGWNGNTPIAILTDFEEFYVIDCRTKPTIKDALDGEIRSFHYTDYADEEKFKWIYWLFSHEAVASGSIEKFLATLKKPKGKAVRGVGAPVDEVFLAELDGYRESLAKGFKKSNQELDGEELTEAVQRTVDRLVFIRFLEDKLIEEKEIANLIDRQMAWELFVGYCKKLEPKYNGLIFKPHRIDREDFNPPDEEVFKEICEGLAGRESPYNFAQIPISILGSIYERFLGKVVHATDKRVKVEEKPEVRKAGGVYYTPDYIVRYIVKETVGKLIEEKTPEEISKMAFADIACGSGSFLIEVYDLLLKYHERYYTEHPEKAKKGDTEQREGRKVLSLKKRQEILVNNIYGVDIDYQATEVTQLSLYLKLLEDVTTNDAYQFSLLKEKILPNLGRNIVCGNSLIGRDITEGNLFPNVDESKLKPMNFEDAFPEVMNPSSGSGGGFDAVVGNPPYVRQEGLGDQKEYFKKEYKAFSSSADLYTYFIERAISLLRGNGLFGYIVANKWLRANFAVPLRAWIKEHQVQQLIDFGDLQVFKGVSAYPCILIIQKDSAKNIFRAAKIETLDSLDLTAHMSQSGFDVLTSSLNDAGWALVNRREAALIDKLKKSRTTLKEFLDGKLFFGIKTGLNEAFVIDEKMKDEFILKNAGSKDILRPYLMGRDIKRYEKPRAGNYLLYLPNGWTERRYNGIKDKWKAFEAEFPAIAKHLSKFESKAKARYDQGKFWWELRPCVYYSEFEKEKIMLPDISQRGNFILDDRNTFCSNTCYILSSNSRFLLGILNSSLISFFYRNIASVYRGGYLRFFIEYMVQIPLPKMDLSQSEPGILVVQLVERMLAAKEELSKAKTEAETTRLERECETLDRQIDQAVYELYGLTEEEIKVVENV
jgi:type I restriction-modification system DNA methylase subunit